MKVRADALSHHRETASPDERGGDGRTIRRGGPSFPGRATCRCAVNHQYPRLCSFSIGAVPQIRAPYTFKRHTSPVKSGGEEYHCRRCDQKRKGGGLPRHLRFHSLRHGAASVLLAAGVSPELAAKLLGHEHIGTFLDQHADTLQEAGREAADRVDAFMERRRAVGGGTGGAGSRQPSGRG